MSLQLGNRGRIFASALVTLAISAGCITVNLDGTPVPAAPQVPTAPPAPTSPPAAKAPTAPPAPTIAPRPTAAPTQPPPPTPTPEPRRVPGIPVKLPDRWGPGMVSYGVVNGRAVLRDGDDVWDSSNPEFGRPFVQPSNIRPDAIDDWLPLFELNDPDLDGVFSYIVMPDGRDLVIVMRINFFTLLQFYYDARGNRLTQLLIPMTALDSYSFPSVYQASPDGSYIAFDAYGCLSCGGHVPKKILYEIETGRAENIGEVQEFSWAANGVYTFKDTIFVDCAEPGPGPCVQPPEELPVHTGEF